MWLHHTFAVEELIPVLQQFTVQRFAITALWPERRRGSPNAKAFIAFLVELFPATPSWKDEVNKTSASVG